MLNSFFRKQQHILMFMDIRLLLNSFPNRDVPIEWLWLKADDFVLHMPWILHLCRISPATSLQPDVGGEHYSCPVLVLFLSGKSCPVSVRPDSVCLDSVRCPIFLKNAVLSLSVRIFAVSILSGVRILEKSCPLSVCLSRRTWTRQSCPDFHCQRLDETG